MLGLSRFTEIVVRTLAAMASIAADVCAVVRRARVPAVTAGAVRLRVKTWCGTNETD
jgi:hypothetical protein